jgi:hypothetical protein
VFFFVREEGNDRKRYDGKKAGEFSSYGRKFGRDQGSGCKIICEERLYLFERKKIASFLVLYEKLFLLHVF